MKLINRLNKKKNLFNDIDTFIFDFDNTIVDEEYWVSQRWKKTIVYAETKLNISKFNSNFWKIYNKRGFQYKFHIDDLQAKLKFSHNNRNLIIKNFLNQKCKDKLIKDFDKFFNIIQKNYKISLISNGKKAIQIDRLKELKLFNKFDSLTFNLMYKKPSKEIFKIAIKKLKSSFKSSIYIGDDYEIDCLTPLRVGMKSIYFSSYSKRSKDINFYNYSNYKDLINEYIKYEKNTK